MRKLNKNNGITLIALVISIIVMLILVAVSISMAVNGGLFNYAGKAVGDTQNAMKNEQGLIDDIIENYIKPNTKKDEEITEIPTTPSFSVVCEKEGKNGWYRDDVTVTITSQNENCKIAYSVSGAQTVSEREGTSVTITEEGESTITAYTFNALGEKSEATTITIKKDSVPPVFGFRTVGGAAGYAAFRLYNVGDTTSGIDDNYKVKISYKPSIEENDEYTVWYNDEPNDNGSYEIYFDSSIGVIDVMAEVEDVAGNVGSVTLMYQSTCFVAGTKVLTENGLKNIEEIELGEMVYAININTQEIETKTVIGLINGFSNELYEITVGDIVMKVTPGHKFYIENEGWVRACELEIGEELFSIGTEEKMIISSIKSVYYEEPIPVYNLTIEGDHNYFVTKYNFLVHNGPECS